MSQYVINTGALPNDGTGTPLRTAFTDTNLNFNQIFAAGPVGSNIQISNNTIITTNVNGNLILATNGTGVIKASTSILPDQANLRMIGSYNNRFNTVYTQYLDTQSATIAGNLAVNGNLYVTGNTVTANTSVLNVANATITVSAGAPYPALADGSGLLVGGANAAFLYAANGNLWQSNLPIQAPAFIGDGSQLSNVIANVDASAVVGTTLNGGILYSSLTRVGALTSLTVVGNLSVGQNILSNTITTGEISAIAFFGNGAGLTDIVGSNVIGNVANATYATFAGTAGTANLAATATQALNAQNAVNALNAQTANTAQFADIANWANCADLATTAYQANSAVVAGRAETIDIQANITVTGNVVAGAIKSDNYLFANGTPVTFGGGSSYSNANVSSFLPTYSGDLNNLINVTVYGMTNLTDAEITGNTLANTISAQGNIQGAAVYADGFFYGNGTPFTGSGFVLGDQQFYGNGSAGPYTMTQSSTNNSVIVTINGLTQTPGTTYSVSGNQISFSDNININELVDIRFLGTGGGGGPTNTGNIGFNVDTIYDINGMLINNSDLSHGPTSGIIIPVNGNIQTPAQFYNTYGNLLVTAGNGTGTNSTWTFDGNGNLTLPTNASSINYANGAPYGGSGGSGANLLAVTTDIIPTGNNSQSLGNATNQWQDLWVSNATIYFNSVPLTLNANNQLTIGNSTIVTTSGTGNTLSVTDLSVTGNITAGFLYGNGAGLTNINAGNIVGAYGNANVEAYLPTSNTIIGIQNSLANTNSNVSNLSTSVTGLTNSLANTNSNVSNLSTSVTGLTDSLANTNSNVTNVASNVTTLQGQVYANANVAAYLPTYTGNISAGNIATTGQISIQGNVAAQGIVSAVGNIVTDGYFVGNFAGNITGNIVAPGANTQVIFNTNGNVDAVGGLTYNKDSNVLAVLGSVTAQGNVYGNVFVGNGSQLTSLPAPTVTQDITSNGAMSIMLYDGNIKYNNYATVEPVSGNITGGNISSQGQVNTPLVNLGATIAGPAAGGTTDKVTLYDFGTSEYNYAIGAEDHAVWFGVDSFNAGFKFYAGNVANTRIGGDGSISTVGNISAGNISTTGNISGNYFIGNGSQLTGISTASTGNLEITGTLIEIAAGATETSIVISPSGPTGGQAFVDVPDNATANTANLRIYNSLGNIELGTNSGSSSWYFDNTGNIILPTNGAVNFAGGSIKQTLNEDFYIRASDDESDGWSIYNVVDDGADNILSQTRLEYNQYSITTDAQGAFPYTWLFRESGQLDLPGDIAGNVGGNLTIKIVDQASSDTFIDLQTRSYIGDALISNIHIAPNITISTANAAHTWTFDNTGVLTLPRDVAGNTDPFLTIEGGDTPTIQSTDASQTGPANLSIVSNYLELSGYTGNAVTIFADEGLISTSANLQLQTPNGIPSSTANPSSPGGGYNIGTYTGLATTGGTGTGLTVNATATGGYIDSVTINTPGSGYTNGDTITMVGGDGSGCTFTVGVSANNWTFTTTGNLTLPGNTFAVNYANGTQVSIGGGSANTGNVTFNNQIILGTGSNDGGGGLYLAPGNASIANSAVQYLRVRGGDQPTHIHLDTGNNAYYDQYFGADTKFVKLEANGNIVINADDSAANSATWTFGTTGNLTLPGNTFAVNYANGTQVNISGGSANTGNVTFDDVTVQGVNGLQLSAGPDFTANAAYLQVRAGDQASHIHLDTGDNSTYDLLVGDDNKYVQIGLAGNISIASYDNTGPGQYIWNFDTAGNLVLPTINLGVGLDEQTVIQSQRKLIPPFRWSAEITADTPTVVYTATDVNTTSMKVTIQVQHQGLGMELFEVFATFTGSDTFYAVTNRVAPSTIADTDVLVDLNGSNTMQITLTINSGAGSSWVTYDAVEFGIPND